MFKSPVNDNDTAVPLSLSLSELFEKGLHAITEPRYGHNSQCRRPLVLEQTPVASLVE